MSHDKATALRLRVRTFIELELLKSSIASDEVGLAPEDRLILTLILLDRLETPATGPSYAAIAAKLEDMMSESTVARRCKAMEKQGLIKRLQSGLTVVNAERFHATALSLYTLYRDRICAVELEINDGQCSAQNAKGPSKKTRVPAKTHAPGSQGPGTQTSKA